MRPPEYRSLMQPQLVRLFRDENVKPEWDVAKGSKDAYTRTLYCPKIDMAIGPFNTDGDVTSNLKRIEETIQQHWELIESLVDASETPVGDTAKFLEGKNRNPRCFMAIEVEYSGTTKHRLGDIANVSFLGSIGVVIPLTERNRKSFIRLKKYLEYGIDVHKLPPSFGNVVIVTPDNFLKVITDT